MLRRLKATQTATGGRSTTTLAAAAAAADQTGSAGRRDAKQRDAATGTLRST